MLGLKPNAHDRVVDQIITALESAEGVPPWRPRYTEGERNAATGLPLRGTGAPYRGLNVVILWITALTQGYQSRHWFTLKQANALGRMIRKGETATTVCFFDRREKTNPETGETEEFCFLKTFRVFNAEQLTDQPDWTRPAPAAEVNPDARDARLEGFVAATGAVLDHEGPPPCYLPGRDRIRVPAFATFENGDFYYGTLLHELVHWSGHASRLDRLAPPDTDRGRRRQAYGYEELVAELGTCMLAARFGLSPDVLQDAAGYLKGWLELMRADKAAVIAAASAASRAADYLLAFDPAA